jgi:SAM-dependent methyltransferase
MERQPPVVDMKLGYILKNIALNAATPAVERLRRRPATLGVDGDLDRVRTVLQWLAEPLRLMGITIEGADVLELGPGRTCELLAAFVLAGARSGAGLDVSLLVTPESVSTARLNTIANMLNDADGAFLRAVGSSSETVQHRLEGIAERDAVPLSFQKYDGASVPLPAQSIDLVVSRSVLEHVRRGDLEHLLAELHRVLRPEGRMIHVIDLRDHMQLARRRAAAGPSFSDVTGDWLDALTYPDWLFRAMVSRRPVSINRLRVNQWCEAFVSAGFRLAYRHDYRLPLPPSASSGRLQQPWTSLPLEVLEVAQVILGLERG